MVGRAVSNADSHDSFGYGWLLIMMLLIFAVPACSGKDNHAVTTPDGVTPELWSTLSNELELQLALLPEKTVATPPRSPLSRTILALSNETQLGWGYYSVGDYDQNSEVNAADLVPLAIHFGKTALPGKFPPNTIEAVVDGDNNGEINLGDITPIAINYLNTVHEYRIYRTADTADYPGDDPLADNGAAGLETTVPFAEATGDPAAQRLQFSYIITEQVEGDYFWVRPADSSGEGIASNIVGPMEAPLFSVSGRVVTVYYNTPVDNVTVSLGGVASAEVVTTDDGVFSFDGLKDGEYTVALERAGWEIDLPNVDLQVAGNDVDLTDITATAVNWARSWGGPEDDFYPSSHYSSDGCVYSIGYSRDEHGDSKGILIHKMNDAGRTVWLRRWIGETLMKTPNCLIDDQGNFYFTAYQEYEEGSDRDRAVLVKLNSSGAMVWQKAYFWNGTPENRITGASMTAKVVDGEGNIYTGGSLSVDYIGPTTGSDLLLMKIDSNGNLLWQRTWTGEDSSEGKGSVVFSADGNLLFTGKLGLESPKSTDPTYFHIIKTDLNGEILMSKFWGYEFHNGIGGVYVDDSGSLYLTGTTRSNLPDSQGKLLVMKVVDPFVIQWQRQWSLGIMSSSGSGISLDPDGNVFVIGRVGTVFSTTPHIFKWSATGDYLYAQEWNPTASPGGGFGDVHFEPEQNVLRISGNADKPQGLWVDAYGVSDSISTTVLNWPMSPGTTPEGYMADIAGTLSTPEDIVFDTGGGRSDLIELWYRPE